MTFKRWGISMILDRTRGILLLILSATTFSTAGIFTKAVDAGAWDIIFWRATGSIGFILLWLYLRGNLKHELGYFRRPGLLAAIASATGTAAFIPAFKLSSVAHVTLIYATVPFVAAALAFLFIRERPALRVMIAATMACVGVGIVMSTSFGSAALSGDLLACLMTLMMGGVIVIYRIWPKTSASLPALFSCVMLLPFAWLYGNPAHVSGHEILILLGFGLVFAVASVTLAAGARYLPASETGLLSMLETPLAPVLAYFILKEHIDLQTLIGGIIVMVAVVWAQGK